MCGALEPLRPHEGVDQVDEDDDRSDAAEDVFEHGKSPLRSGARAQRYVQPQNGE